MEHRPSLGHIVSPGKMSKLSNPTIPAASVDLAIIDLIMVESGVTLIIFGAF
jgi:hypothetical protein